MKSILNTFISETIEDLKSAQLKLESNKVNTLVINHDYFDQKFMNNENISTYFDEFTALKKINKPVLYWFQINSSNNNKALRTHFINYRDPLKKDFKHPKYRYTSAYKKNYSDSSKTLYVGKVEKGFWGRLVTHLGYSKYKSTAGMQLFHWYNPTLYGNITLNYIVFDNEMKHLIAVLEKQLANKLEPLIGIY